MRSPEDGVWFPLAYINGGGMDLHWMRTLFGYDQYDELEEQAALVAPGSEGLLFIPHFAGRILPSVPEMHGGFVGLTWNHGKGHLFRAAMEGIAYEYALYLESLHKLYPDTHFRTMYSIGGGAKSSLFVQIKSDVLGVNAVSFHQADTALLGTAAIAGTGIGLIQDCKKAILSAQCKKQEYQFNTLHHKNYQLYRDAYASLLNLLSHYYQSN